MIARVDVDRRARDHPRHRAAQVERRLADVGTAASGVFHVSLSRDGAVAYTPATSSDERFLVWVDRAGRSQRIPADPRAYIYPRLSPDGHKIAFEYYSNMYDYSRGTNVWKSWIDWASGPYVDNSYTYTGPFAVLIDNCGIY